MTVPSEPVSDPVDPRLSVVMGERRRLTGLAYRLLGSLADAEDVVQDAYTRWYALSPGQREDIDSPGAWLAKAVGRLCLNVLSSARVRRETYVGEWLPEPLPGPAERDGGGPVGPFGDPADRVTLDESVTMAFLVVLESMTPAERVAFVLHDVFRYPFADVAQVVGRTPAACRQLAVSARRRVRTAHAPASPAARQAGVVKAFKRAWEEGDIDSLVRLLDPDATVTADGGGRVRTARRPISGAERIARTLFGFAGRVDDLTLVERTVNGRPGLVAQRDGRTVTVTAFQVENGLITHIWAVRNPDKLRSWA
ncbi:RNA polymerase sigma factor SigJ [Nocardiopsis sp. RSe5-2]|uniref:RNA polymerase sigma factor SigJ n=1 Tax=Nocardiopsis endophytica TaxID=3018445 RepID=A0ABT4U4T9_9ACTN|nr:RNA polymerase sigma factor SigJ [Nocardiopsis endophytica]MDA2811347.1 RNA polymerase sigma factor SigJ [Nocardiopsis endophytica]